MREMTADAYPFAQLLPHTRARIYIDIVAVPLRPTRRLRGAHTHPAAFLGTLLILRPAAPQSCREHVLNLAVGGNYVRRLTPLRPIPLPQRQVGLAVLVDDHGLVLAHLPHIERVGLVRRVLPREAAPSRWHSSLAAPSPPESSVQRGKPLHFTHGIASDRGDASLSHLDLELVR
ncbi:hypothetical protein SMALB_6066 [Streptomyces malaysiensis]|uniref:Uncharacterized protein n=1 Tax=Streptomyces malaysiensis TaxID=92644 RepID=A0A7X5X8X7_STRMQ|nr:hypothetical protein [Streptomyces malaysiensis]